MKKIVQVIVGLFRKKTFRGVFLGVVATIVATTILLSLFLGMVAIIYSTLWSWKELNKEDAEWDPIPEIYNGRIFNERHRELLLLDFSKIEEDYELSFVAGMYIPEGWKVKDYLTTYLLACEICAREEINEKVDYEAQIQPEDLIGAWLLNSGMSPGAFRGEVTEGTYLRWVKVVNQKMEKHTNDTEDDENESSTSGSVSSLASSDSSDHATSSDSSVSSGDSSSTAVSSTPTWDTPEEGRDIGGFFDITKSRNEKEKVGPYQFYKNSYSLSKDAYKYGRPAMYISWMENPELQTDLRAIGGIPKDIAEGRGSYINKAFMGDIIRYGEQTVGRFTASRETIENTMKIGNLGSTGDTDFSNMRPSGEFLPDAMYTYALYIRMALESVTPTWERLGIAGYDNVRVSQVLPEVRQKYVDKVRVGYAMETLYKAGPHLEVWPELDSDGNLIGGKYGTMSRLLLSAAITETADYYYLSTLTAQEQLDIMTSRYSMQELITGYSMVKGDSTLKSKPLPDTLKEDADSFQGVYADLPPTPNMVQTMVKQYGDAKWIGQGYADQMVGNVAIKTLEHVVDFAKGVEAWKREEPKEEEDEKPVEEEVPVNPEYPVPGDFEYAVGSNGWAFPVPKGIPCSYSRNSDSRYGQDYDIGLGGRRGVANLAMTYGSINCTGIDYSYGHYAVLYMEQENIYAMYAHLDGAPYVIAGQPVQIGQPLGIIGGSGGTSVLGEQGYAIHVHIDWRANPGVYATVRNLYLETAFDNLLMGPKAYGTPYNNN